MVESGFEVSMDRAINNDQRLKENYKIILLQCFMFQRKVTELNNVHSVFWTHGQRASYTIHSYVFR